MADGSVARAPRKMPVQKPGMSVQSYATDRRLLPAIEKRFGRIRWDLAASAENAVCDAFIGEQQNSLTIDWHRLKGLLFLNPPFGSIAPWAKKCAEESAKGARILLLTPASVGSDWYRLHVAPNAYVLALTPRLTFVGETTPFPKDCVLSLFFAGLRGFDVWRWR